MAKYPTPPGLRADGKALWKSIAPKYELRPDELTVLAAACKTADTAAEIEKAWVDLGRPYLTRGSMGQDVIHPLLGERKAQNAALARLLAQLKLPDDPAAGAPNQQRDAAQSRWASSGAGA